MRTRASIAAEPPSCLPSPDYVARGRASGVLSSIRLSCAGQAPWNTVPKCRRSSQDGAFLQVVRREHDIGLYPIRDPWLSTSALRASSRRRPGRTFHVSLATTCGRAHVACDKELFGCCARAVLAALAAIAYRKCGRLMIRISTNCACGDSVVTSQNWLVWKEKGMLGIASMSRSELQRGQILTPPSAELADRGKPLEVPRARTVAV